MKENQDSTTVEQPKTSQDVPKACQQTLTKESYVLSLTCDAHLGISTFLSSEQAPFSAIQKALFEDFHVHEVAPTEFGASVVSLKSLEVNDGDDSKYLPPKTQAEDLSWEGAQEMVETIKKFSETKDETEVMIKADNMSKEDRTKLHQFIRQDYSNCESTTYVQNQESFVKVMKKRRRDEQGNQQRVDRRWPPGKPDYFRFVLYKENVDTDSAIRAIAGNMDVKRFQVSGTKDRRAITTQHVTGYRIRPTEVAKNAKRFNSNARNFQRIEVGHFELTTEKNFFGKHLSNRFDIVLRNLRPLPGAEEKFEFSTSKTVFRNHVQESLKHLQDNGFINYFGLQRFGSFSLDNHLVGAAILKKDYKKAIEMILNIRTNSAFYKKAFEHWKTTEDATTAYEMLDKRTKNSQEGRLLNALGKAGKNNYLNALMTGMSRYQRMMYLHAFQSCVWNLAATARIETYGLKPVVGDIVDSKLYRDQHSSEQTEEEDIDEETTPTEFPLASLRQDKKEEPKPVKQETLEPYICLTEENVHLYDISDVHLPLLSANMLVPKNLMANFLRCQLKLFGISLEDFHSFQKEWCLNGGQRRLIAKAFDLNWAWFTYTNDRASVIISDLDYVHARASPKQLDLQELFIKNLKKNSSNDPLKMAEAEMLEEKIEQLKEVIAQKVEQEDASKQPSTEDASAEKLDGVFLQFHLRKGAFATMALREVTKISSLTLEGKPPNLEMCSQQVMQKYEHLRERIFSNRDKLQDTNNEEEVAKIESDIVKDVETLVAKQQKVRQMDVDSVQESSKSPVESVVEKRELNLNSAEMQQQSSPQTEKTNVENVQNDARKNVDDFIVSCTEQQPKLSDLVPEDFSVEKKKIEKLQTEPMEEESANSQKPTQQNADDEPMVKRAKQG